MSFLTAQQIKSMSSAELANHYGVGFSIDISRSCQTNTPMIVFRSTSRGLVTVLGTHHAHKLCQMQPGWKPWTSGPRADKSVDGYYYCVISLKGLRPSTLRRWVDKALDLGFVMSIEDGILSQPTTAAESTVEVVESIPEEAKVIVTPAPTQYIPLNPIQARVMSMTAKEMKAYLREIGEKTSGNKKQLQERVMASI